MRIRKDKQLTLRGYFTDYPHVHFCQLNQSPWDVITAENGGSVPSAPPQLRGGKNFAGNGGLGGAGNSMGATDSVDSMDSDEKVAVDMMTKLVVESPNMKKSEKSIKGNGKFKFELKKPTKKHGNDIASSSKKVAEKKNVLRGRSRGAKKGSAPISNSKSSEFYYYTGFGPFRGKKRGGSEEISGTNNAENKSNGSSSTKKRSLSSSSSSDQEDENEYMDLIEEEDDEDYEEIGRKKMKKPVKEKSLKSLMQ